MIMTGAQIRRAINRYMVCLRVYYKRVVEHTTNPGRVMMMMRMMRHLRNYVCGQGAICTCSYKWVVFVTSKQGG